MLYITKLHLKNWQKLSQNTRELGGVKKLKNGKIVKKDELNRYINKIIVSNELLFKKRIKKDGRKKVN